MSGKQLPGYGGNMDTAAADLSHYQKMDFSTLVLCGSRRRAEILQQMLGEKNISALQCIPLTTMPKPGQILLAEGTLPYGMEYPNAKLAVLSEGQLTAKATPKKKSKKSATNRQKLNSFTDLSPGDLVVHENYGIGRFVAMEQIRVDNAVKDYIKKFEKYGKPIWMTEFCAWDPVPSNVEKQMDYMCSVLNHMEQNPHVERYAWFMPRTSGKVDSAPYMQLLTHGSPVLLTPLGQIFTQFSSFDKNAYLSLEEGIGAHQYIALKDESISLRVTDNNQLYIQSFMQGQWIDYQVNAQSKQPLQIQYASIVNSQVCISIDGVAQAIVELPKTADMQTVTTLTTTVIPPLGNHTLRIEALKGTFNCYQLLQ